MIKTVQIRVSAGHPDMPLEPSAVIQGSAATIGVLDVPRRRCGVEITTVAVTVVNADGTTDTEPAKLVSGVWSATFPADYFATPGFVQNGVTVTAGGKDENETVREWILGRGDFEVLSADAVPQPGEAWQNVHYRANVPDDPVVGDLAKVDGAWKLYTEGGWQMLGGGAVDSVNGKTGAVELTGADIATSAEDEKTVADSLAAKADEFTEWELEDKTLHFGILPTFDGSDQWYCTIQDQSGNNNDCYAPGGNDEINLSFFGDAIESADATRKRVLRAGDAPTSEQFSEVSSKVDDIKSAVSTNNRFLVNDTTAAIQTHDAETDKWTDEIRVDKGYDAVTGSTMVKLDKSVQTVTVSGGSLTVELPDAVDGTVRDLCLYVNNTSPTATVTMAFPASVTVYKSKGGDDPKAAAQAGGITAYYFTEIPGGAWRVMRDELEVAT